MLGLKAHRFSDSQASTVDCFEQDPKFKIVDAGKKACNLLHAEDNRQFSSSWAGRQTITVVNFSVTDVPVEIGNPAQIALAGCPFQFSLCKKVVEIGPNLIVG
jgi:hypothetical protein